MLSTTGIKLRIYLRTHDGDNVFVELEKIFGIRVQYCSGLLPDDNAKPKRNCPPIRASKESS
ncbi:MAG: hypothetical protein ACYCZL_07170 [Polaromonas sp.]